MFWVHVELHPAFDTLFRLSKEHELKKSTIELSESADFTNKKTLPKKCFFLMAGTTRLSWIIGGSQLLHSVFVFLTKNSTPSSCSQGRD